MYKKKKTREENNPRKTKNRRKKNNIKRKKNTHFHYIISLDNHAKKKFASTKTFLQAKAIPKLIFPFYHFFYPQQKAKQIKK